MALSAIAKRLFGTANDRLLTKLQPEVDAINALEPEMDGLNDDELRARTEHLKERHKAGETLDDLMVEAFATVREAAKRTLGERVYDVQLVGGMVLHQGRIAEMKTGEGKTLVSTLPIYLNALSGLGCHIVTVNDYLAKRDSEWMGQVYNFLGMEVGCILPGLSDEDRKSAYAADVTYGTNNELGFDYLRDNMKFTRASMCQRPFNYAIVDEVDSILIDEARTPLIISGPTEDSSDLYVQADKLIPRLVEEDYEKDEKTKNISLTEEGTEHIEELLKQAGLLKEGGLYDYGNVSLVHHVNQALKAHKMFAADTDYIVKDGQIMLIDQFTGRMMEGRRLSEGLHQAIEAKEKVEIHNENQTLASVTFQNYFRLYPKLAGMTGTAATEAAEFEDIYGLHVVEVPTHEPVCRIDEDDEIYRTADEKYDAVLGLVEECRERQQPILVGTVSIEKSEHISKLLKKKKIPHNVLNARYHEEEAHIIAQAGRLGAVTIATNMAGRGTDIKLGGNVEMRIADETEKINDPDKIKKLAVAITAAVEKEKQEALDAGGLFVVGTERHESRRIDNQLRGRTGRQGDPGNSRFFLSLEDDLMRIFAAERLDSLMQRFQLPEGEPIVHPWINKALERAQQKVEAQHFDARKNILKYDDVMNDQRKVIYEQRIELMDTDDVSDTVVDMRHDIVESLVASHIPPKVYAEKWDVSGLEVEIRRIFGIDVPAQEWAREEGIADEEITERLREVTDRRMGERATTFGPATMRLVEKSILLQTLDQLWKDHLLQLDQLRQSVQLRSYAQKDPLNEYKSEAFEMFEGMLDRLREDVTAILAHIEVRTEEPIEAPKAAAPRQIVESRVDPAFGGEADPMNQPIPGGTDRSRQAASVIDPAKPETWGRMSRNQQCPCGSGKKYKHCHGRFA